MADAAELPQWLSWGAGAVAIIISTVIIRLGWASRKETAVSEEPVRLAGAIVDSRTVSDLASAIEAHSAVARASAEGIERAGDRLGDELRNLGDEVRRLGNKLER